MKVIFPIILVFIILSTAIFAQENKQPQASAKNVAAKLSASNTQEISSIVKWYTIEEALMLNKTKPKKIMIDVYTDWCGWCKKMDKDVFSHPIIGRYLNEYYYPVKFNAESTAPIDFNGQKFINENNGTRSAHQLASALLKGQMSYPSIAYFTEKLEYMGAMPGYKTPDQLEVILNFIAQDKFKTTTLEEFQKSFVGQIKPVVQ
jgi:thioredoxin-related protein